MSKHRPRTGERVTMESSRGNTSAGTGVKNVDGQPKKMCQVFLRNLPLAMLEPDIETMLADCGPIKRIDLIKTTDSETGAKHSRGFGFVTFALEADASKAVQIIHKKRVMGREVSCEIARKKGTKRESNALGQAGRISQQAAEPAVNSSKGREGVASSYGGSNPAPQRDTTPPVPQAEPPSIGGKRQDKQEKEKKEPGDKMSTKTGSKEGDAGKVAAPTAMAVAVATVMAAASNEDGPELSKKDARKLARKAMKKERKAKAKERAKDKKKALVDQGAVAAEAKSAPLVASPADDRDAGIGNDSVAAVEGAAEEETGSIDSKFAKLTQDALTLLIFGVADDLSAKQLQKRVKKYATVTALTLEENEKGYLPVGRIARVVCGGKEGTRKIIAGVDGHTVHGQTLRARRLMEIVPGHDVRQQKQQRLIVRNLNFHAKKDDLAKAFSEFGPLAEVHIPTVRVTSQKRIRGTDEQETVTEDRSRGFGFVQFLCPKDAARVVKDHGVLKICGRDAAVDYSITKEKFNALKQGGTNANTPETSRPTDSDESDGDNDEGDEAEGADGMDIDSDEDDDDDNEDDGGETSGDDSDDSGDEAEGRESNAAGVSGGSDRPRAPDVQHRCTVFVRNVAFDCGQQEVKERFSEFGNVRLALLVKDRATGMPRGTAFVKFAQKEEADRCLAAAIGATDPAHARDSGGSCVYLGTRALHITRAVDREQAGRLTVGAQKRVGHKDKRNLYLADEGLVLEDSTAAEGAAKADMEKRIMARKDKKSKLKNPIFFVSPVRLSVRNLARHVSDSKLKAMAAAAARAGIDAGRANPQDVRLYLEAQGEEFAAITPKRLQIPNVTAAAVVKAKIIRDMDKKPSTDDPSELNPSKGYGFVEFAHHGQALAALRHLNNNPSFSGQARSEGAAKGESSRLIVEFSVENHAKLKLQQSRKDAFEQRKRELKALGLGQDGRPLAKTDDDKDKKSRGKIQREKKKQQAESMDTTAKDASNTTAVYISGKSDKSPKNKRKSPDTKNLRADVDERAEGYADEETDGLVGGKEAAGEDKPKRKKRKKKVSQYERVDNEERAIQKLERAYTAKTETAAGADATRAKSKGKRGVDVVREGETAEAAGGGARKKERTGRWFE